jgi:hypothetical protein
VVAMIGVSRFELGARWLGHGGRGDPPETDVPG